MQVCFIQSVEGLIEQKHWGRENLLSLPDDLSWDIGLLHSDYDLNHWFSRFSGLQTWTETVPPAFRRQIMGLLTFHDQVSQFLINYVSDILYMENPEKNTCPTDPSDILSYCSFPAHFTPATQALVPLSTCLAHDYLRAFVFAVPSSRNSCKLEGHIFVPSIPLDSHSNVPFLDGFPRTSLYSQCLDTGV